jgi:hypothetical protein
MATTGDDGTIRISDADRDAVVELLRRHTGDGRLAMDEFEERAGRVYGARTRADLGGVLGDLPALPGPMAPAAVWAGAPAPKGPPQSPPSWSAPVGPSQWDPGRASWVPSASPARSGRGTCAGRGAVGSFAAIAFLVLAIGAVVGLGTFWPIWIGAFVVFRMIGGGRYRHRHDRYHTTP